MVEYFLVIIDGSKVSWSKFDLEVFLKVVVDFEVDFGESIVFEDVEVGIEVVILGGFYLVGVGDVEVLDWVVVVIKGFVGL